MLTKMNVGEVPERIISMYLRRLEDVDDETEMRSSEPRGRGRIMTPPAQNFEPSEWCKAR